MLNTVVVLKHLTPDIGEREIKEYLQGRGMDAKDMTRSKTTAFVELGKLRDMNRLLDEKVIHINGHRIVVEKSKRPLTHKEHDSHFPAPAERPQAQLRPQQEQKSAPEKQSQPLTNDQFRKMFIKK
eukprot:TRINITY_DN8862_c0_g1_i1.p1 TRINITY_DN8862_c0_g1~~TRINITY_DN8862_c0_g1_i1.p1  ORF type:complete len:126 (-),score=37.49 TRINITY_DN8862_c0_g1_i1:102-479(-)